MKHSSLVAFLNGELSIEAFGIEIANEVDACKLSLESEGYGRIIVTGGPLELVTRNHARRLLQAALSEQLSLFTANYIAECLIMSDDFDFADECVSEALFFIADDSRLPTQEEIKAAIMALG